MTVEDQQKKVTSGTSSGRGFQHTIEADIPVCKECVLNGTFEHMLT